jgi:hypothetical protein
MSPFQVIDFAFKLLSFKCFSFSPTSLIVSMELAELWFLCNSETLQLCYKIFNYWSDSYACTSAWRKKILLYYFMTYSHWPLNGARICWCVMLVPVYICSSDTVHIEMSLLVHDSLKIYLYGYDILSISIMHLYYCFLRASESLLLFCCFFQFTNDHP